MRANRFHRPSRVADRPYRALFVYPRFTAPSFWNYRATCELTGAKYPAIPLGLLTVAAMLPERWQVRLVDCNVQPLHDADIEWADLVFSGGMISQQLDHLELIERVHRLGRRIVVGGTDPTSSPQIYDAADALVLNEAEVTLPRFLADLERGTVKHRYASSEMADVTMSPIPRYDLIDFDDYLHVGVQYARGCPFNCEFCDIIELFGRRPRVKRPEQMLAELQRLYDLGYRGHVDFVDDNFIGNKRTVKALLPQIENWLEEHRHPFEFSTEASLNLAHDDELLALMQAANFSAIFVGIESPDEETLIAMQKKQNLRGSIVENIQKIYRRGIFVNAGFIIGFDTEYGHVAEGLIECIEATGIPVAMVGLLAALPNTQLTRRLAREGRLLDEYDRVQTERGNDQCTGGLNFVPVRDRAAILRDYHAVIERIYDAGAYFARVRRTARQLDQSRKKLRLPLRYWIKDLKSLMRFVWRLGIKAKYRRHVWQTLLHNLLTNPRAFKYAAALCALYLHFGEFSEFLKRELDKQIAAELEHPGKSYTQIVAEREQIDDFEADCDSDCGPREFVAEAGLSVGAAAARRS